MDWLTNNPLLKKSGFFYCRLEARSGFYSGSYKHNDKNEAWSALH